MQAAAGAGSQTLVKTAAKTVQLIAISDAEATQLKNPVGKDISVKVDEDACAQNAGQICHVMITT